MGRVSKYQVVKAFIPYQVIMGDCNAHHVYLVHENGTSDLLGAFRLLRHAKAFMNLLESGVLR